MRRWIWVLLLLAGGGCSDAARPSPQQRLACQSLTGGTLRTTAIRLEVGASRDDEGRIAAGRVPRCDESAEAWRTYQQAHEAWSLIPKQLRPEPLLILLGPRLPSAAAPVRGTETDRTNSTLLVARGAARQLSQAVWLHEMAHLRARGPRPSSLMARRIYTALDEGVADYYAAAVGGSPLLGGGSEEDEGRDLRSPPPHSAYGWASVAVPVLRFDAHEMGWQLAARFWQAEPAPGPLLTDLLAGLASDDPLPPPRAGLGEVLKSFWQRCPARSRSRIRAELTAWVPAEIKGDHIAREVDHDGESTL